MPYFCKIVNFQIKKWYQVFIKILIFCTSSASIRKNIDPCLKHQQLPSAECDQRPADRRGGSQVSVVTNDSNYLSKLTFCSNAALGPQRSVAPPSSSPTPRQSYRRFFMTPWGPRRRWRTPTSPPAITEGRLCSPSRPLRPSTAWRQSPAAWPRPSGQAE